ncbi:hypothetical protein RR46_12779 [Papilio xuthus]|uniref:Uncharacterized protein n=1 Tax=Papilio xuthus TaxID=66420 RepID=A0A194PVG1_PAPXU|nr:hypothetical protein RR46_12779 [Papilio xuthus]
MSKRDSIIENNTSTLGLQQRNYLKSKLLLVKKRTSVVFLDVNNFAEYDICLQGMFKDPSKVSSHKSQKSISFDIPEDNESLQSSIESSHSPYPCCIKNCQDADEPKCMLGDNHDNELSNECKNKLCNAKTSPIKVKLPLPKCIDCTRDNKQCDMGLNTLPQYIACETDIEEQCELILEEHNAEADELTFSVFEISTEKQLRHVIYDLESATSSYHSSLRRKESSQTCVALGSDEPCNLILSEDVELTFSDFETMDENQLHDIICQLQNAMLSCDSNPHRPSFEINEKHCDNDGLTFGDFQRMSIKQLKDIISEIEAMNSDCDTSTALEVEASSDTESINTSCMSDEVQESVSSAVYSLSTYTSDAESNHAGVHKLREVFKGVESNLI